MKTTVLRDLANRVLFSVHALEESGNDAASQALDFYDERKLNIIGSPAFVSILNEFITANADVLLNDHHEIFGVNVGRVSIQFPSHEVVTFKYMTSEDNYSAVGVSFQLICHKLMPYYIQVNDRTSFYVPGTVKDVGNPKMVEAFMRWAFSFMSDSEEKESPPVGGNLYHVMTYPLTDPRISLHPDDCDTPEKQLAYTAISDILSMLAEYSPVTHETITGTWSTSHNLDTNKFRLRTYDYHDSDETLTWNFVWRDIAIQWYKRPGRALCINRIPTVAEIGEMLFECDAEMSRHTFPPERPKVDRESLNTNPEAIARKLMANSTSGAHLPHVGQDPSELLTAQCKVKKD